MNIFCYGCFDLFHTGHLNFLNEASSHGGKLFVGILPDSFIKKHKGANRPIICQKERTEIVGAIKCVHSAFVLKKTKAKFKNLAEKEKNGLEMFYNILKPLKIDAIFLPSVYTVSNEFKALMQNCNIKIITGKNFVHGVSTTKIINKISLN